MKKQRYVVGFMFSAISNEVALIRKQKPAWQAGLLNGIGGKIEGVETPWEAMAREFQEEAGLWIPPTDWKQFCTLLGPDWEVVCFCTQGLTSKLVSQEEELIEIISLQMVHSWNVKTVGNVRWLIPLAQDALSSSGPASVLVTYSR